MKNDKHVMREELTDEQLNKLYTKQLIKVKNGVNASKTHHYLTAGPRCCEECQEYIGDNWDAEVKPYLDKCDAYLKRIKAILATRPHVPNKLESKEIRKQKIKKGK